MNGGSFYMKVLKTGNDKSISMDVTCPVCGARLRIEPEDLCSALGCNEYYYRCPCCYRNCFLSQNEISDSMKLALKGTSQPLNLELDTEELHRALSYLKRK